MYMYKKANEGVGFALLSRASASGKLIKTGRVNQTSGTRKVVVASGPSARSHTSTPTQSKLLLDIYVHNFGATSEQQSTICTNSPTYTYSAIYIFKMKSSIYIYNIYMLVFLYINQLLYINTSLNNLVVPNGFNSNWSVSYIRKVYITMYSGERNAIVCYIWKSSNEKGR